MIEIESFDPKLGYKPKTKRELFDSNLNALRRENKDQELFFTLETLKQITKVPMILIKELIDDKVIFRVPKLVNGYVELNNTHGFIVNNKKAYCKICEYDHFVKMHTEKHDMRDLSFYEYEIDYHLIHWHMFTKDKNHFNVYRIINDEIYKQYITFDKPEYKISEHDFEIVEINNSDLDTLDIKVKCKICNYEHTSRSNVVTCTRELKN